MGKSKGGGGPDDGPKTVSEAIREAIRAQELTAYAVAKRAGVSVDAVQRFLNGERGLTLATVDKVAVALGLELRPRD